MSEIVRNRQGDTNLLPLRSLSCKRKCQHIITMVNSAARSKLLSDTGRVSFDGKTLPRIGFRPQDHDSSGEAALDWHAPERRTYGDDSSLDMICG